MLIAHLTDTHIVPPGERGTGDIDPAVRLERCIDDINSLRPRPDAVLITGDLTERGREDEYAELRRVLEWLTAPYFLIPGNHDATAAMRGAFADHRYLFGDEAFMHYAIDDFPVRLIGLDTRVPGQSSGRLCDARLAWLERRLGERPDLPSLLLMHHPPIDVGIPHMDAIRCHNAGGLYRLLGRHGQVLHILCGHVHRMVHGSLNGVAVTVGPSTAHAVQLNFEAQDELSLVADPPAFCLLNINDAGATTVHVNYIGNKLC